MEYELCPALILDLDGTVRRSKSGKTFISDVKDIDIIWNTIHASQIYKNRGYLILGATNQGGVAHGFKDEAQVLLEIEETKDLINLELSESFFDEVFFAPSDEKGKVFPYNYRSLLRKPDYGMLVEMEVFYFQKRNIIIDWSNSMFVGDRTEDELCAANANISFFYVNKFLENHGFPKI